MAVLRNVLAVIVGLVVGGSVNVGLILLGRRWSRRRLAGGASRPA